MARPRMPYRLSKHRRNDKKTGQGIESRSWYIFFRDHLQREQKLKGTSDMRTSEYIARNVSI